MTRADTKSAGGTQAAVLHGLCRRALTCATLVAALLGPFGLDTAKADEVMIENCLKAAADLHHVPAGLLVLLINVEAGRLGAVSQNSNGTVDIGPMQVNDAWVPKIARHWRASTDASYQALRDSFCANVEGGAWILRQALDEARGSLWEGVALYHSHAPIHKLEYMRLVYAQAMRLKRESIRDGAIADARPADR
jgi:Transglycosylase SLT domain